MEREVHLSFLQYLVPLARNNRSKISYTYDKNGNIETITEGTGMVKYFYNNLDELKGEEYYSSGKLVKKLTYSYDAGGNIKEKSTVTYSETGEAGSPDVISYSYDPAWKDLLTSYNGQSLSYDAIGNLTNYAGYSYTWEGRELKSISGNGLDVSFKYNSDGIRTEKAEGSRVTKYYLIGDKVTYQETIDTSSNTITDKMYFIYDAAGKLVSMELDGVRYDYIRNAQGDITGLMDMAGNKVVSYSYDSWGKLESIDGSLKDSLGIENPYRYRGYRYDTETGLYYLQSRYYNPDWGRFINADALAGQVGELLSHNVFAYAKNNPINMSDPSGFRPVFDDEETQRQYDDWVWEQQARASSVSVKSNNGVTKKELASMGKNIVKNSGTGYLRYLATNLSKPSKVALNRGMERAGQYLLIPGSKLAKGIGAGLAIFGVIDTISSIRDDWNNSKTWQERAGKIAIDGSVFIFSTIAGAAGSPATGAVIGFGLNIIGDAVKNYYWDN